MILCPQVFQFIQKLTVLLEFKNLDTFWPNHYPSTPGWFVNAAMAFIKLPDSRMRLKVPLPKGAPCVSFCDREHLVFGSIA